MDIELLMPEKLKRTFEQLTPSPDRKLGLIAEFWAALDKVEQDAKVE